MKKIYLWGIFFALIVTALTLHNAMAYEKYSQVGFADIRADYPGQEQVASERVGYLVKHNKYTQQLSDTRLYLKLDEVMTSTTNFMDSSGWATMLVVRVLDVR